MIGCVYKITSPTDRVYIGKTTNLELRVLAYKNLNCKNQRLLYNSLKKYGFDKHGFLILDYCDVSVLDDRERYYIKKYKSNHTKFKGTGLNLTDGGEGTRGIVWTEESRRKNSISLKGKPKSKKHRENISKATKGRKLSEEHRNNIRKNHARAKPWLGKKLSEEHKQKLRDAWKKKKGTHPPRGPMSEETKRKLSEGRKGRIKRGDIGTAKKVINVQTNVVYDCILTASEQEGIKYWKLKNMLKDGSAANVGLKYYVG